MLGFRGAGDGDGDGDGDDAGPSSRRGGRARGRLLLSSRMCRNCGKALYD